MIDISVIIVNYNTCQITIQCLDSIFRYTKDVDFEVIVVDNCSERDDSKIALAKYPGIIYIQSEKNLGFGKANNLGYEKSSGKYVLLLNSDTYLMNNALKYIVDTFNYLPENVACVGAQLLSPEGNDNNSYGELPSIKRSLKSIMDLYLFPLGIRKVNSNNIVSNVLPFEVPYVMGADLCIRKTVIDKLGLFDPDFFMYYEESEMQYRYQKAGYKSMIISGPKIVHLECASTRVKSNKRYTYTNRKMFLQGQFLYFRKRYNYLVYIIYRILFLLNFPLYLRNYYSLGDRIKLIGRLFSSTRLSRQ